MYLVQLLLPVRDKHRSCYPYHFLAPLHQTLVAKFGGLTGYSQAPAKGNWLSEGKEERDDIVVLEVMVHDLDRIWWRRLREKLETDFDQKEIVVKTLEIARL